MKEKFKILQGNCLETLKQLEDNSIQCCITSPPYYGLRDYGTSHWEGGDINCSHNNFEDENGTIKCIDCGAIKVDEQIGLEGTPEEYIQSLVGVFHEVHRVLREDGILFINIGDSYASNMRSNHNFEYSSGRGSNNDNICKTISIKDDVKQKDLIGIPWMLAFALRKDGWYLRQDIIWHKPNPMPESVKDRFTKSHEYIFMMTKSDRYYFSEEGSMEEAISYDGRTKILNDSQHKYEGQDDHINRAPDYRWKFMTSTNIKFGGNKFQELGERIYSGNEWQPKCNEDLIPIRKVRDVWSVPTNNFKGTHFATYPEKLVEKCLFVATKQGDIVLDPFSGSGTTGVVATRNGRKYIGCELNEEYAQMSYDRVNEASSKEVLW